MSGVIWGIINLKNDDVSEKQGIEMIKPMRKYKIDKYKNIKFNNIFLGCGIQYLTEQSLYEVLPFRDTEDDLIITADAIIDNRKEILDELGISQRKEDDFTDSQYILMCYKKWGNECTKHLLGDFAFVIWNEKKHELFCARDHIGRRTLYYYKSKEKFIFSTLIDPILIAMRNEEITLNERWITDFLALSGGVEVSEDEETIYRNIKHVQPAHSILVDDSGNITKEEYWNPLKEKHELKLLNDKEYIDLFLNIYTKAVKCRLRALGDIGLMLSGGLDSSSVAALSTKFLREQGRVLKTFTSVPVKEFEKEDTEFYSFNEQKDVERLKDFLGNIDDSFCDFRGENCVDNIDYLIDIYEQPYKVMETSYYIDGGAKLAAESNCRVLLNGQYGNVTISQGDFYTQAITLLHKGRLLKTIKEINSCCKIQKCSRKKFSKEVIKTLLPYKYRVKRFYKRNPSYDRFSTSPVNKSLIKKWNVSERFDKIEMNQVIPKENDFELNKKYAVDNLINSGVTNVCEKIGLKYGIIFRDPTADVRIIELCLSIPMNQYVEDGIDRKLIRKSMNNLLPEDIRMNVNKKGVQASDWIDRLKPIWTRIYTELKEMIKNSELSCFLNLEKLNSILENLKDGIDEKDRSSIVTLLEALIFSKFIYKYTLKFNKGFSEIRGNLV